MIPDYSFLSGYPIISDFSTLKSVLFGKNNAIGSILDPKGTKYSIEVLRLFFRKVNMGFIAGTKLESLGQIIAFPSSEPEITILLSSLNLALIP